MLSRYITVNNGGLLQKLYYFRCDNCDEEMFEGDPRYSQDGDYCPNCAYLLDKITTEQFKQLSYWLPPNVKVAKHDGKIFMWAGKREPWLKKDKDRRNTIQYRNWRLAVFKRDSYICQNCDNKGVRIEAHHVLSFHEHESERFNVDNGLTLCRPCHLKVHGRGKV